MSTVLTVAYGILLASLLFSAYEAWTKGGDVRALGVAGVKYLALGALFMNDGAVYERVFRDVLGRSIRSLTPWRAPDRPTYSMHGGTTCSPTAQRSGTFLNLVTAGMPALLERPPSVDRHDCLSGGVRVVRGFLFTLRDDPVRHRSAWCLRLMPSFGLGSLARRYAVNVMIFGPRGV